LQNWKKKKSKEKNYSILFLDRKMSKKTRKKPALDIYIDASDLGFYSIALKFEPQMHKSFIN
jgi:hypothetical protein